MDSLSRLGYITSRNCGICTATDQQGNNLRDLIDHKRSQGATQQLIINDLKEDGVETTQTVLSHHFRKHSPWISEKERLLRESNTYNELESMRVMHRNAEDEIQKLVDIGGKKVDAGDIPVDKELYMFALNKKTQNNVPLSIENLIMNFGDALVEKGTKVRQIIEGEVKEKKLNELP